MELFLNYEHYVQLHRYKGAALFHALREAILQGSLKPHTLLPSTRQLARQYEVSRGTVNSVYDMLLSQGYIYTKAGSGTYVGDVQSQSPEQKQAADQPSELSEWGKRIQGLVQQGIGAVRTIPGGLASSAAVSVQATRRAAIAFSLGKVEMAHFPMKDWNRHLYEQTREQYRYELHDAYASDGHYELKQAIARQVRKERGIAAEADDIMIVNGSQQAITLLAQLLLNEGDYAAMEDPHYVGARHALQSVGARLHTFPVDEHGIRFMPQLQSQSSADESVWLEREPQSPADKSRRLEREPQSPADESWRLEQQSQSLEQKPYAAYKLLLLTPSRQFPTGVVLSLERRLQLLSWAQQHGSYIIEDDYDSEFRHIGRAIEPMKSLDTAGRVIYIGTFSRTMLQDLRIGYAILPDSLKEAFRHAKMVYERHPSSIIQQRALAAFINSGQYDRHMRRLKRLYRRRAEWMQQLLAQRLPEILSPFPAQAGLHIYAVWQKSEQQFELFLQACAAEAVYVIDARRYGLSCRQPALCLGYAHLSEQEIDEGVMRLQRAWDSVCETV